jgi:ActR/RegA family two-component response regulator
MKKLRIDEIPLKILVIDDDSSASSALDRALRQHIVVMDTQFTEKIKDAKPILRSSDINTIFIDPFRPGIDFSSKFIFDIRKTLPEIVFVLYMDIGKAEEQRSEFFRRERRRFTHYYKLDKRTSIDSFDDELASVLRLCQYDLSWRMSQTSIERLLKELSQQEKNKEDMLSTENIREALVSVSAIASRNETEENKTVFVSHRFAEQEYVEGLHRLLEQNGFKVITGKSANTYISKAVVTRIRKYQFFLCLMTRDKEKVDGTFTASPWLLEEKGAALALGKPIVLMVEEGVSDIGGLQGDWQRIHFGPKGFLSAALEAVEQLKSYVGES